jgi:hypothetical protein
MTWLRFQGLQEWYNPPRAQVVHGLVSSVAKSSEDEPDASTVMSGSVEAWVEDHPGLAGPFYPVGASVDVTNGT